MKRSNIILLAVVGVLVLWAIVVRNGLAGATVNIDRKWGEVETNYQYRAKLYTSMVNLIKGAAKNEDTTLIKIVQMRSRIPDVKPDANNTQQLAQIDKQYSELKGAMLNINFEAYPTLKATDLFANLQTNVDGAENRVSRSLKYWNDEISDYNMKVVKFPNNIIAGILGYSKKANYKADEGAKDQTIDFSK